VSIRAKIRTLVGHSEKPTGLTIASPVVSYVFSVRTWLRGVDLNHRPLGYEATEDSNFNNLQDAGGSVSPCK